jgi:hypothetical protein
MFHPRHMIVTPAVTCITENMGIFNVKVSIVQYNILCLNAWFTVWYYTRSRGSVWLRQKPGVGHGPESLPSTSHSDTYYLKMIVVVALANVVRLFLWTAATNRPIVCDIWAWSKNRMILTGENLITWRETCLNATLSTTDLTLADLGVNSDLHGEREARD